MLSFLKHTTEGNWGWELHKSNIIVKGEGTVTLMQDGIWCGNGLTSGLRVGPVVSTNNDGIASAARDTVTSSQDPVLRDDGRGAEPSSGGASQVC